jgi:hypothetical protein
MSRILNPTWYDDLKGESDMRRMAVVANKVTIQFSKINLKESQVNGARLGDALLPHRVEDYMQGFRNGDTFPRPIVHKTPSGYVILSGNQRCEALRRLIAEGDLPKSLEIDVYLVDTNDALLLDALAVSANAAHGEGLSKEERLQHAVDFVRRRGMAVKDAAALLIVSESSIRTHIRAEEVRTELQRAGINTDRVANSVLVPLAKLEYDQSAQVKLGSLVAQHNPSAERTKQVVATVARQTTAPARLQKIKTWEKELAAEAHTSNGHSLPERSRVPHRPRREKFFKLIGGLVNFLESENAGEPFTSFEDMQITSQSDTDRAMTLSKKARYRLGVIVK